MTKITPTVTKSLRRTMDESKAILLNLMRRPDGVSIIEGNAALAWKCCAGPLMAVYREHEQAGSAVRIWKEDRKSRFAVQPPAPVITEAAAVDIGAVKPGSIRAKLIELCSRPEGASNKELAVATHAKNPSWKSLIGASGKAVGRVCVTRTIGNELRYFLVEREI